MPVPHGSDGPMTCKQKLPGLVTALSAFSGTTGGRLPVEEASLPVAKATVGLNADVVDRFA